LIYVIVCHYLKIEADYIKFDNTELSTTTLIFMWIQNHYGYVNIIMGAFIAIWIKIFFRKYDYNYFEILIHLCFVMGIGMLILSVFAIFEGLTHLRLMQISAFLVAIYASWAIGQFFDRKKIINYPKAIAAYVLGLITFTFFAIFSGILFDLIIK